MFANSSYVKAEQQYAMYARGVVGDNPYICDCEDSE